MNIWRVLKILLTCIEFTVIVAVTATGMSILVALLAGSSPRAIWSDYALWFWLPAGLMAYLALGKKTLSIALVASYFVIYIFWRNPIDESWLCILAALTGWVMGWIIFTPIAYLKKKLSEILAVKSVQAA